MKTLLLLRHAKAESGAGAQSDHDRAITDTGRADARRLGARLRATAQQPDLMVSSSAVRARETAEALADPESEATAVPLRTSHALYQAQPADVLDEIQALDAEAETVLMVGHQPTWSTVVSRLIGTASLSLPTGTAVRIDVEREWADVAFGTGTLRWMLPPFVLRDAT